MIRVHDCESRFGVITIFQRRSTGAVIYDQFGSCQSEADANGVSLASYIHAIYGLILQTGAHDVLMIGGGGGTLGTMLARAERKVAIVDINPDAFSLARRYFGLPESVVCHVADGSEFLQSDAHRFDAMVLDAFHGDRIPGHLQSPAFFRLVRSRLKQDGCFFANVHVRDDGDRALDAMARNAADIWPDLRLLDSPGWINRNAILMAGDVARLQPPTLRAIPSELAEQITLELNSMQFRSERDFG